MRKFMKKRFWISLFVFGIFNYLFFWLYIPISILSGNPGADGVAVSGFPLTTKTSGGCNFGGSCMDFNLLHFWINLGLLIIFTALLSYVFSAGKTLADGFKNIGHYLLGWLIVLLLGVALSFVIPLEKILPTETVWQALGASFAYNLYYFLAPEHLPFTFSG